MEPDIFQKIVLSDIIITMSDCEYPVGTTWDLKGIESLVSPWCRVSGRSRWRPTLAHRWHAGNTRENQSKINNGENLQSIHAGWIPFSPMVSARPHLKIRPISGDLKKIDTYFHQNHSRYHTLSKIANFFVWFWNLFFSASPLVPFFLGILFFISLIVKLLHNLKFHFKARNWRTYSGIV